MTLEFKSGPQWLKDRIIFLTYHGSRAYGTEVPGSDVDLRGCAIPPVSHMLGLDSFDHWKAKQLDCVIFDFRKFIRCAANANPNIIELLFTDPEHHAIVTPIGAKLLRNRDLFLTQKAADSYRGYAASVLVQLKKSKGYTSAIKEELVENDYDTKAALHLIRLLTMAVEIISGAGLIVKRPDREMLLDIRNGCYAYDAILEMAVKLELELMAALKKSKLPVEPNQQLVDNLCLELAQDSFSHRIQEPIMATGWFHSYPMVYSSGQLLDKKLTPENKE